MVDQKISPRYWPHDDLLFLNWAISLVQGEWLGPFNSLSLSKVPGYSFFLALCKLFDVRVLMAQQFVFLAAAGLLSYASRIHGCSRLATFLIFSVVALSPESSSLHQTFLMRDFLYESTTIALVALAVILLRQQRWQALGFWGFTFALVLTFHNLLREEFFTIYPLLIMLPVAFYMIHRRESQAFRKALFLALFPLLMIVSTRLVIAKQNQKYYGINEVCNRGVAGGSVDQVFRALSRIETGEVVRFAPITEQMLGLAFEASPTFSTVKESLNQIRDRAKSPEGALVHVKDGNILAGSIGFALVSAAAQSGHFQSGASALSFFDSVTREINEACETGRIPCKSKKYLSLPTFNSSQLTESLMALRNLVLARIIFPDFIRQPEEVRVANLQIGGYLEVAPYYEYLAGEQYKDHVERHFLRKFKFDANEYRSNNPALNFSQISPLQHYLLHGIEDPNIVSSASLSKETLKRYRADHPELRDFGVTTPQYFLMHENLPRTFYIAMPDLKKSRLRNSIAKYFYWIVLPFAAIGVYLFIKFLFVYRSGLSSSDRFFLVTALFIGVTFASRAALLALLFGTSIFGEETERYLMPCFGLYASFVGITLAALCDRLLRMGD